MTPERVPEVTFHTRVRNDALGFAAVRDVTEHQHAADDVAFLVADRGGAVVNGPLRAVFGDEDRVVRQPDDDAFV